MVRYKIVFRDGSIDKCIFGEITLENDLIKVNSDFGNVLYINKKHIIFMKELQGDAA